MQNTKVHKLRIKTFSFHTITREVSDFCFQSECLKIKATTHVVRWAHDSELSGSSANYIGTYPKTIAPLVFPIGDCGYLSKLLTISDICFGNTDKSHFSGVISLFQAESATGSVQTTLATGDDQDYHYDNSHCEENNILFHVKLGIKSKTIAYSF